MAGTSARPDTTKPASWSTGFWRNLINEEAFLFWPLSYVVSTAACAHFQRTHSSEDVVTEGGPVTLDLIFTHPMDRGPTMDMEKPKRFGVKRGDKSHRSQQSAGRAKD